MSKPLADFGVFKACPSRNEILEATLTGRNIFSGATRGPAGAACLPGMVLMLIRYAMSALSCDQTEAMVVRRVSGIFVYLSGGGEGDSGSVMSASSSSGSGILGSARMSVPTEGCSGSGEYSESLSTLGGADESSESNEETDDREMDRELLELPSAKL